MPAKNSRQSRRPQAKTRTASSSFSGPLTFAEQLAQAQADNIRNSLSPKLDQLYRWLERGRQKRMLREASRNLAPKQNRQFSAGDFAADYIKEAGRGAKQSKFEQAAYKAGYLGERQPLRDTFRDQMYKAGFALKRGRPKK
jgi:hypothetical protein